MKKNINNIIIFSQSLQSGGAEKQAVLLANLLSDTYNVTIIIFYGERTSQRITSLIKTNINIVLLRGVFLKKIVRLFSIFRNQRPHILFNYLLFPSLIGGIINKLAGNDISIGGIRNALLESNKVMPNRFAANYLNNKTIFNNYTGYNRYINKGFSRKRLLVIPNGINVTTELMFRKNIDKPNILSVGRFEKAKDYYTALNAISGLFKKGEKFNYTIVGWGTQEKEIKDWIEKLNIPKESVTIIVNPKKLDKYYLKADIYLQTSLYEGLSNTVLEAMSFSLPLVVTNAGDNNKLVSNNINGYIVKPKQVAEIIKSLQILINDHEKRLKFGTRSYNNLINNYSITRLKENYQSIINQLVS